MSKYLDRRVQNEGNPYMWTWAGWVRPDLLDDEMMFFTAGNSTNDASFQFRFIGNRIDFSTYSTGYGVTTNTYNLFRDHGAWYHILISIDTYNANEGERLAIYVNGIRVPQSIRAQGALPLGHSFYTGVAGQLQRIGARTPNTNWYFHGGMADTYFVEDQALGPEVFGFHKSGTGASAYKVLGHGTSFTSGQWSPKPSRIVRETINQSGGFGTNGYYLPLNGDYAGFDHSVEPNSIIELQTDLAQPKVLPKTTATGDYSDVLRNDEFGQYCVLAVPLFREAKDNGYGDYSGYINGTNTFAEIRSPGLVDSSTETEMDGGDGLLYGSATIFQRANSEALKYRLPNDISMGTRDFCIEGWYKFRNRSSDFNAFSLHADNGTSRRLFTQFRVNNASTDFHTRYYGSSTSYDSDAIGWDDNHINKWIHFALTRENGIQRYFMNGVCVGTRTNTENIATVREVTIGWMYGDGTTKYHDGWVQDFRFYMDTAKYTENFEVGNHFDNTGSQLEIFRTGYDSPTNKFSHIEKYGGSSGLVSVDAGNLRVYGSTSSNIAEKPSSLGFRTGRWYAEVYVDNTGATTNHWHAGVSTKGFYKRDSTNANGVQSGDVIITVVPNSPSTSTSPLIAASGNAVFTVGDLNGQAQAGQGDVIGIAVDADNHLCQFYVNGVTYGPQFTYSIATDNQNNWHHFAAHGRSGSSQIWNFGQNPEFSGVFTEVENASSYNTDANGYGKFKYAPPTGYLALCSQNLPTPSFDVSDYFKPITYQGTSKNRDVDVGFPPGLIMLKERSSTSAFHYFDKLRGVRARHYSPGGLSEAQVLNQVRGFGKTGFAMGDSAGTNEDGFNYAAWVWRAGDEVVEDTSGDITVDRCTNTTSGLSIVEYTGTGLSVSSSSPARIPTGLNGKSSWSLIVNTNGGAGISNIWSYHGDGNGQGGDVIWRGRFDTNLTGQDDSSDALQHREAGFISLENVAVTSSGSRFLVYTWEEIEGFSKFGVYQGNLSTNGPFVYCGFRPALVIVKNQTVGGYWNFWDSARDPTNPVNKSLFSNATDTEQSGSNYDVDFTSTGFRLRTGSAGHLNGSGNQMVYMAFAEAPLKYSNAR